MIAYVLRRLLGSVPVILIGLSLTFFIIHLAPGDPTIRFLRPGTDPGLQEVIVSRFGLDQPLIVQYLTWLKRVIGHLDFGFSFHNGRPAAEVVLEALPPTILVTGLALLVGLGLGIAGGITAAVHQGTKYDRWITAILLFFYSMPAFWLGMLLLGLFAVKLNWLPASQLTSIFHSQLSPGARLLDYLKHLVLPVTTLGLVTAATFGRYLRASMIEALSSEYVLAARARGLNRRKVLVKYALRNALIPLISLVGMTIPVLFSGAVVIEVIFSLPGMGKTMVEAVMGRDYPVILAASMFAFGAVVVGNLLADIGYALADPRVRLWEDQT
jgi:peptide/nickel transport system permease protein